MNATGGTAAIHRHPEIWQSVWARDWEQRATWSLIGLGVAASLGGGSLPRWDTAVLIGGTVWLVCVGLAWRRSDEVWRLWVREWGRRLWPWWFLNVWVLCGLLNPLFEPATLRGGDVLLPVDGWRFWPGTADAARTVEELWRWNVVVLAPLSAALFIRTAAGWLRVLYGVGGVALVYAAAGTLLKLMGNPEYLGGFFVSPSPRFFAQFVYANHWAAYAVLQLGLWAALLHYGRWHTGGERGGARWVLAPAALALLLISVLASGSRSGAVLAGVIMLATAVLTWRRAAHSNDGLRRWVRVVGWLSLIVVLFGAWVGRKELARRADLTRVQISEAIAVGAANARLVLYRDTMQVFAARPFTGWGLGSYAVVFPRFNTQWAEDMRAPVNYRNAHNDWLQLLAEGGVVGSGLALLTLRALCFGIRGAWQSRSARLLLGALALLMVQAGLDFPAANLAVAMTASICLCAAVHHREVVRSENPACGLIRS